MTDNPKFVYGNPNPNYTGVKRAAAGSTTELDPTGDIVDTDAVELEAPEDFWFDYERENDGTTVLNYDEELEVHQEKIDALRSQLDDIIESGDADAAMGFAMNLVSGEDYTNIMNSQDNRLTSHERHDEEFKSLNKRLNDAIANDKDFDEADAALLYENGSAAVNDYEEYKGMRVLAEDYKNLFATAVNYSYENGGVDSPIESFDGQQIGDLVSIGEFESGSREWLELRQGGMGGSDIATIADKRSAYYRKNLEEVWESKINPISDEQVEEQTRGQYEFTDAASRGNALEGFTGYLYAKENPDMQVMRSKATFASGEDSAQINYDLLLCDDGSGVPNGTLEIKSSSRPEDWGEPEDGLNGVPAGYRAQALAQCSKAGFTHGAIGVLINETDYRTYSFRMDEELVAEAEMNQATTDKFYDLVKQARETGDTSFPAEFSVSSRPAAKGFQKSYLSSGLAGDKGRLFSSIAKMRGVSKDEVKQEFLASMPADKKQWSDEEISSNLTALYTNSDLSNATFTGVDLETNSFSGTKGRIIEVGAIDKNMGTGEKSDTFSELYGISKASKATTGTGPEDVHGISLADVADKAPLASEEAQKRVLDRLTSNGVIVAHNASFEKGFLRSQVKGFAEAEARGDIYFVDTMNVSKHTMPDTPNNKMDSFTEANGVEYVNAHRASADAEMMMDAFYNWQSQYGNKSDDII